MVILNPIRDDSEEEPSPAQKPAYSKSPLSTAVGTTAHSSPGIPVCVQSCSQDARLLCLWAGVST